VLEASVTRSAITALALTRMPSWARRPGPNFNALSSAWSTSNVLVVAFRGYERAAIRRALTEHDGVLALGGGAVMDPATRALLKPQRVVFLDVGLAAAVKRVGFARDRPVLAANPRSMLAKLLDERRPLYEEVATVTVSTDNVPVDAVLDAVVKALQLEERVR